jgi:hypothetical protein
MPAIDGAVDEAEWKGAVRLVAGGGDAYLLTSGRTLCIAVRMARPYAGERVSLHVAERRGPNYSGHFFHPACTLPPISSYPTAPVLVRRGSFALIKDTPWSAPASCLFRARVFEDAGSWSAEAAISLDGLDVSPVQPLVFQLNVADPAGSVPQIEFAPAATEAPQGWQPLGVTWPPDPPPFLTPEEDRRRAFELSLCLESMLVLRGEEAAGPLSGALSHRLSRKRTAALIERLDECLAADPRDHFAAAMKAAVLLRANRIEDSWKAEKALSDVELARGSLLAASLRRQLLCAEMRFEEAARLDLPGKDQIRALMVAWRAELARRDRDARRDDLPRVAFETNRGRVVVELFAEEAPKGAAHLVALAEAGAFDKVAFDTVTGGAFAQATPGASERIAAEETGRIAWRGSVTFAEGAVRFRTGHDGAPAVGRIVEGMEHIDALEFGDDIRSATVARPREATR